MPSGHCFVDESPCQGAERWRTAFDRFSPAAHLICLDAMFPPGAAFGERIVHHRHEAIQGEGETCFWRFTRVEFIPSCAQALGLIVGQQAEDSIGCHLLALGLRGGALHVIGEGIASIDFDQVVDQQQLNHTAGIDRFRSEFRENKCHQRHMPAVLGAILATAAVEQAIAAEDAFQAIQFEDESKLPFERPKLGREMVGHGVGKWVCGRAFSAQRIGLSTDKGI